MFIFVCKCYGMKIRIVSELCTLCINNFQSVNRFQRAWRIAILRVHNSKTSKNVYTIPEDAYKIFFVIEFAILNEKEHRNPNL